MSEIDLEKLVIEQLQSDTFAYALAEAIASKYGEKLFDEFGDDIAEQMHNRVKSMAKKFVDDFSIESDTKGLVKKAFDNISKQELINILAPKPSPLLDGEKTG